MTITVASLKKVKNSVIGNPLAKVELAREEIFVSTLIDCLNSPVADIPKPSNISRDHKLSTPNPSRLPDFYQSSHDALRIEAAHVIASISYGSEEALSVLLRHNTHHAFLYAISHFTPSDPPALRAAFLRAFRAFATSLADVVGPSLWGLRPEDSMLKNEARQALDHIFHVDSLDVYLPLLLSSPSTSHISTFTSPSNLITTSVAQMLAGTMRCSPYRQAVREWLPPAERQREVPSRRGWEKPPALSTNAASPWICKQLLSALGDPGQEKDSKLTEALLSAFALLAQENPTVASFLVRTVPDTDQPPISKILAFMKSRSADVQLAACLCLTHTFRASSSSSGGPQRHYPSSTPHHTSTSSHPHSSPSSSLAPIPPSALPSMEETGTRMVMNVVNRIITLPPLEGTAAGSSPESAQTKTRACFILHYLLKDDAALCSEAFERGCLEHVAALIHSINPVEPAPPEWEEHEPESISCLREATLTALASLALFSDDIRRRITDELRLLPCISRALRATRHVGTRYAAAQCVRSISRAVSVLRTNIVDSGLGIDVLRVVLGRGLNGKLGVGLHPSGSSEGNAGWKGKQTRVSRKTARDGGGGCEMDVEDGHKGSEGRLILGEDRRVIGAALAAVCNIVTDFSPLRPDYIEGGLIPRLVLILKESGDPGLRLSSLWGLKNLVRKTSVETKLDVMGHLGWFYLVDLLDDSDEDIQEQAFNIVRNLAENDEGIEMVFREVGPQVLGRVAEALTSSNENVVLQAAYAFGNLSNGTLEQQDSIVSYPRLLSALQHCIAESKSEIRRPVISAIYELAKANPRRRRDMAEVGIVGTLKRLCEWSGYTPAAGGHGHGGHGPGYGGGSMSPTAGSASHPHSHWGGRRTSMSIGGASGGHYGHLHTHGHGPSISHSIGGGIGMEEDRDVIATARAALDWLEHAEGFTL